MDEFWRDVLPLSLDTVEGKLKSFLLFLPNTKEGIIRATRQIERPEARNLDLDATWRLEGRF